MIVCVIDTNRPTVQTAGGGLRVGNRTPRPGGSCSMTRQLQVQGARCVLSNKHVPCRRPTPNAEVLLLAEDAPPLSPRPSLALLRGRAEFPRSLYLGCWVSALCQWAPNVGNFLHTDTREGRGVQCWWSGNEVPLPTRTPVSVIRAQRSSYTENTPG